MTLLKIIGVTILFMWMLVAALIYSLTIGEYAVAVIATLLIIGGVIDLGIRFRKDMKGQDK